MKLERTVVNNHFEEVKDFSERSIEIIKKWIIEPQEPQEIKFIRGGKKSNRMYGFDYEKIERTIRYSKEEKQFYILYDSGKYYVKPNTEPLNKYDLPLQWTVAQ